MRVTLHLLLPLLLLQAATLRATTPPRPLAMGLPDPSIWPQPASLRLGEQLATVAPSFAFDLQAGATGPFMVAATQRTLARLHETTQLHYVQAYPAPQPLPAPSGVVHSLAVSVLQPDTPLSLASDEAYNLTISAAGVAQLTARTQWGALHGLTSFLQLVQSTGSAQVIRGLPLTVVDKPRFPWRGFLMDTARHYFPVAQIRKMIDALALIKMNVLHWHIVDAESFPIQLQTRPLLAQYGAYSYKATYSSQDIRDIVSYGMARGVRVVPEVDTPGHTFSWGAAYPDIIVNCSKVVVGSGKSTPNLDNVLLDMTNDLTYEVVADVVSEFGKLFADDFMHYGGDEVAKSCLEEVPHIKQWMQEHLHSSDYDDLIRYYTKKLLGFATTANKRPVFWQEAFTNNGPDFLPANAIIQVWIKSGRMDIINAALEANLDVLVSSGWYLDQQIPSVNGTTHYSFEQTWRDFYLNEPTFGLKEGLDLSHLKGGTACMWGEQVDRTSIWGRVLPRAAATAERLWSPKDCTALLPAEKRLVKLTCRLTQYGIASTPIRPDYCESADLA